MIIATVLFLFFLSLIFAFLEIEIDGKYGWAENLPTWYKKVSFSPKPLTGYQLFTLIFIFMMLHLGFFLGSTWSAVLEMQIFAFYFILLITEDFLWFVLNPEYGIKKFCRDKIWWHHESKWIFMFPQWYFLGIIISSMLFFISSRLAGNPRVFFDFLAILVILAYLVLIASFLLPKEYKRWYFFIRKKDDRGKFNIFH